MKGFHIILVVFGSLFLLILLYIAARLPAITVVLNIDESGDTADFFNSISAPITGIIGAVLVFASFRAQIQANKIQFATLAEQRDLDPLYKFYDELKHDLKGMQGDFGPKYSQLAILDSLMNPSLTPKYSLTYIQNLPPICYTSSINSNSWPIA